MRFRPAQIVNMSPPERSTTLSFQPATVKLETMLTSVQAPAWQADVDRSTSAEWSEMLDFFDDANIYQTWAYGAVRWGSKNLSHIVLRRNGEVVAMAQLRIVRPGNLNLGMAYLRWGPVCHRKGSQLEHEICVRMARCLEEEYVERRNLYLQVLPNAFVGSRRGNMFQSAFARFQPASRNPVDADRTFIVDLAPSIQDLRRNLDKKWRNQLTCAEKNRLRIVAGTGQEQYTIFCTLYRQMRNRKNFDTTVDIGEFGNIQEHLPETHRMQVLICEREGVPVAGLVTSAMGNSAIYLLGATSDSGLNAKGSYLLQWTAIQWLKENGVRWYDLGGIDPDRNPGVYHFKRGLSGADVTQLPVVVVCRSVFSSALVKAGLAIRDAVHSLRNFPIPSTLRGRLPKATSNAPQTSERAPIN